MDELNLGYDNFQEDVKKYLKETINIYTLKMDNTNLDDITKRYICTLKNNNYEIDIFIDFPYMKVNYDVLSRKGNTRISKVLEIEEDWDKRQFYRTNFIDTDTEYIDELKYLNKMFLHFYKQIL